MLRFLDEARSYGQIWEDLAWSVNSGARDHILREAARARAQDAIDLAADRTALKLPQRTADPLVPGDLGSCGSPCTSSAW